MSKIINLIIISALGWPLVAWGGADFPKNVHIQFFEKSYTIAWDPVPNALGYNVYTSPAKKQRCR